MDAFSCLWFSNTNLKSFKLSFSFCYSKKFGFLIKWLKTFGKLFIMEFHFKSSEYSNFTSNSFHFCILYSEEFSTIYKENVIFFCILIFDLLPTGVRTKKLRKKWNNRILWKKLKRGYRVWSTNHERQRWKVYCVYYCSWFFA